MKVLSGILLLVVLTVAVIVVWVGESPQPQPEGLVGGQGPVIRTADGDVAKIRASEPAPESSYRDPSTRAQWALLRPPEEADLPDPDDIGPCPPAKLTGHHDDSPVVRRGLENGIPTWWHKNGTFTQIYPSSQKNAQGQMVDGVSYAVGDPRIDKAKIDVRLEDPRVGSGDTTGGVGGAPKGKSKNGSN